LRMGAGNSQGFACTIPIRTCILRIKQALSVD
jgi:hypothetical protein